MSADKGHQRANNSYQNVCYDKNILNLEKGPDKYREKNTDSFVESVVMS